MVNHKKDLSKEVINFLVIYMLGIFSTVALLSLFSMYMQHTPDPIPLDYDYVNIHQQLTC